MGTIAGLSGSASASASASEVEDNTTLVVLAANIQEGLNSSQISWSNIDWSLFPARPGWPDYTITHDLDSISVFISIAAADEPEFEETLDQYGNPIRIVDYAEDLFLAIGGTDGNDHLRGKDYSFPDGTGEQLKITGALMGFSGDDALYSDHFYTPMLMGGSGDDAYILDAVTGSEADSGSVFVQIVEHGNDDNDSIISYNNDWAFAGDIDGQHLILADETQSDVVIIWDYNAPDAKIENFWFDFDNNGLNEHYTFDEFISKIHKNDFWLGSLSSEELGISRVTTEELAQTISEAVLLSTQIEELRIADDDTALSVARLYQAAFDRTPDLGGLNYWVDNWESNMSLFDIAGHFYNSDEFNLSYGEVSDDEYVTLLYANVLDRVPDTAGFNYWTDVLSQGIDTHAGVLVGFSDSLENKVNTELQLSGLEESLPGNWVL